ncbi:MAG: methylenetetrahydrofolate reductase [NAD(P)H] [Verrucomicrobiales bacterium]|nr:methylenetetrahydrofolate reductase [NAD(P)H] [Verrucomicrobiales bacterium]
MRFIRDIFAEASAEGRPVVSCEFFPTKTPEGERSLLEKTIPRLKAAGPSFCSVTYGAGGSTRGKTLDIVEAIQNEHDLPAMAHLTCVGSTAEDIGGFLNEAQARGIKNILALRGDPPAGENVFVKPEGGFEFSYQLVEAIHAHGGFSIGTAGFPEGHIACTEGKDVDWQRLKEKVDHGADFVITQLFFDNEDFFRFRDHLRSLGMGRPITAGIIPILSGAQIRRFTDLCGAKLTPALSAKLEELGDDNDAVRQFGVQYATEQCQGLLKAGVEGLHFYTLNKSYSTVQILDNLGLAGQVE